MEQEQKTSTCELCGARKKTSQSHGMAVCSTCRTIISNVKNHPDIVRRAWQELRDEPILPRPAQAVHTEDPDLPDVLDGKRYRTIDRDRNKWYLSISELDGRPVEVFASTAFDRDHELQSRISNLTTITRLISLILRHIFIGERLTLEKVLKQIKRSSRQKNDLPDMLYGVLSRYDSAQAEQDLRRKSA
ncbi:hypothetical protein GF1_15880 [Desulfolithobacter dissulfuricans]|uniref:ribonucleoside-diphosphate reductase n=1 Tax=Desulfolithobacter dissulfuricans TaxID=2795293 RepID=A0A915U293_9BACT|nr:hypothetical protein [Desulfolithobacter dissulfuricans]BCO09212.1 hypothetical protein GF1_15880 [Desulfolithobacter dissulfuricans]